MLGVVQGISEWLPISSKTQILIVSSLVLGLTFNEGYTLGLFLELGSFIAAGGASPLDPDYDWQFTIAPHRGRLLVTAVAVGHAVPAQVAFAVPGVTRWTVWMLAADGKTWQTDWSDPSVMPRAVVIAFWNGNRLSGLPLHLSLWPGSTPTIADSLSIPSGAQLAAVGLEAR